MNLKKGKLMLFIAASFASTGAFCQYNNEYTESGYVDNPTNTSVVELSNNQVLSLGSSDPNISGTSGKDFSLTKTDASGVPIWSYNYGQLLYNEIGYSLTLTSDQQHVIVVGSSSYMGQNGTQTPSPLQAFTSKIRISDGAHIWTTSHGTPAQDEEAFMIERVNDGIVQNPSYVVVGRSSGSSTQGSDRMYAFKINENGSEIWSKRYLLSAGTGLIYIRPTSMVRNGFNRLMIAGLESEINRPTQLFTTGINTVTGAVVDDLIEYSISNVFNVKTCDIAKDPDGSGFALAFTPDNYSGTCILPPGGNVQSTIDRIGIMQLSQSRKPVWTGIYWNPDAENNNAVSIEISGGTYNVATSYTYNTFPIDLNRPALLRVNKSTSSVISNHFYSSSFVTAYGDQANCLIPSNNGGYLMKTFIPSNNGFTLVKINSIGEAPCDQTIGVVNCKTSTSGKAKKSAPVNYGSTGFSFFTRTPFPSNSYKCSTLQSGTKSLLPSQEEENGTRLKVYPSPISAHQTSLTVEFQSEMENTTTKIHVYDAMGKEVLTHQFNMTEGKNTTHINPQQLTPGVYTFVIEADQTIIERSKFIKQ